MKNKLSILEKYKEGSRTGQVSLLKNEKNLYHILVDWDDPRYNSILLFSGKLPQCINFSAHRFGINKKNFPSLKFWSNIPIAKKIKE